MYQTPICKNDRCSHLVPASKNPGKERLFCTSRCARRYHARLSYQREAGPTGGNSLFVNPLGQAQVNRRISLTAKAAEIRFKGHLGACALHSGPCPGRSDPYGRKKLCLIGAVFSDDWSHLKDAEEGKPIRRYSTTPDGRWLVDLSVEEREGLRKREGQNTEPAMTSEQFEAAIAAGAGKVESEFGIPSEDLARYNEGLPLASS